MKNETPKTIIIRFILCFGCTKILDRILCISSPLNTLNTAINFLLDILITFSGFCLEYVLRAYLKKQVNKITYVIAATAWTQFAMAYYLYNDSNDMLVTIGSILIIITTLPAIYYLTTTTPPK